MNDSKNSNSTLKETLDQIEAGFSGLRETARLVLAVIASTRLKRRQPLAVILVGGPSSGKTTLLMPFTKGQQGTKVKDQVLRVDDFSAASLVSHAANKTEEQLAKIDLLPKLKGKVVIVKEMAPVFTGHEDDLMNKFGIFASILDGEGYTSSKGSHGQRGYSDPIIFTLLGAVTPNVIRGKVTKALDAVGPRFSFWNIPKRKIDADSWRGPTQDHFELEGKAEAALVSFAEHLFAQHEPGSIPREAFSVGEEAHRKLSLIAFTMAAMRSRGVEERDDLGNTLGIEITSESPERAYRYLEQIVFGSALSDGRREITNDDLRLALWIAIGSASTSRSSVMGALVSAGGRMRTRDLAIAMNKSVDSAENYTKFMEEQKFIERVNNDGIIEWDLAKTYRPLRTIHAPGLIQEEQIKKFLDDGELPF